MDATVEIQKLLPQYIQAYEPVKTITLLMHARNNICIPLNPDEVGHWSPMLLLPQLSAELDWTTLTQQPLVRWCFPDKEIKHVIQANTNIATPVLYRTQVIRSQTRLS